MNALIELIPPRLMPTGLSAETAIVALAGMAAFLVVLAIWYALLERDPMERRARMLADRRDALRGEMLRRKSHQRGRQESLSLMRQVVGALKLMQSKQTNRFQDRLAQAGLRSRDAIVVFLFFKAAAPILAAATAFALLYVGQFWELSSQLKPLLVVGAAALGFFAPELYVGNRIERRRQALQRALPDGLDLLVICAESGLSLDAALDRVAGEISTASPELGEELALTSIELGFLPDRRQALHNLNRRTALPAIRGVVNTLVQTEKYGTPLSQSLRVLASEFRDARMLRAEEKAARLPATLTVPMIVFILPTLFIVLIGPAVLSIMDNLG
jgi:tight adherence protein C